jgi:hypothetical protein
MSFGYMWNDSKSLLIKHYSDMITKVSSRFITINLMIDHAFVSVVS